MPSLDNLQKAEMSIARFNLVHGGEILQTSEAIADIRQKLTEKGYNEYESFEIEKIADWDNLLKGEQNLSLFQSRKLVQLNLKDKVLTKTGENALYEFLVNLPEEHATLVVAKKISKAGLGSKWADFISKNGNIVIAKEFTSQNFLPWLKQKIKKENLDLENDLVNYLADIYANNPLDASNALKILNIAFNGRISLEEARPYVLMNANHSIFELVDFCLQGNSLKVITILENINLDQEAMLVVWALNRELEKLLNIHQLLMQNHNFATISTKLGIWRQHTSKYQAAVKRLSLTDIQSLIDFCCKVDIMVKGALKGDFKASLQAICLAICGTPTLTEEDMTICQNL